MNIRTMSHEKDNSKTMPEDPRGGDAAGGLLMGREKIFRRFFKEV